MQVEITARHGDVSQGLQNHIQEKAEKLLTYFERVTAIQVTIDFEEEHSTNPVKVEILVDAEHKHNFVASDKGDEVMPVFDSTLHKMEAQIRKYKEKLQDHRRDPKISEVASGDDES